MSRMQPRPHRPRRAKRVGGPPTVRRVAFTVLSQHKNEGRFVSQLLEHELAQTPGFPSDERRLAVELINGVVRRRLTLDTLLLPHVSRPRHRIEGELWTLLQIGTYQLAFLDAIPPYAAVNETVLLAKRPAAADGTDLSTEFCGRSNRHSRTSSRTNPPRTRCLSATAAIGGSLGFSFAIPIRIPLATWPRVSVFPAG